jgi:hypothetical protein
VSARAPVRLFLRLVYREITGYKVRNSRWWAEMSKNFKVGNQVFGARKDLAGKKGIITAKTNAANGRAEFVVRWEGSAAGCHTVVQLPSS